ncbi:starch synthase [Bradyrhizobium japonicum]|jgi:starch synthase|uniref:Glycogen synthase n=1 Tax=Bradyrhizobium elkanii TaxID=29448 RepID=A0ABV4EUZ3_BRAEL|nr:glycogen synthase GlgA [Bradyrhizobium elkanii]MBP2428514.1 starch synthase [Bradyrhizobium elkanii]MCP1729268.1 starch synthase [Bradyrhizobium elkanii]MCP1756002.1 starch synthase [Bradyrhizobium elkanii]MCP1971709.1 starch synthase [Bradyrhizobium elkanii]MCP1981517.1 starch synthase [Bradyrhizobium elkanii]
MTQLRVLAVASEVYPIVKTGGLADVVGALPAALQRHGVTTRTLVPGYPDVLKALASAETLLHWPEFYGGPIRVLGGARDGLDLFALDAPHLYARPGNPYVGPDGRDWPDNGIRFAALSRMAAEIGQGAITSFVPDIVHAHDWQAGLAPALLHYAGQPRPGTVMTVHNLAYQGQFSPDMLAAFGLPGESYALQGVEYYGTISLLKAGLQFADRITTVSPTYAREIQSDEGGMGLGGLLRERADVLSGILNGIDISVWNPATDPDIAARFSAAQPAERAVNKAALQRRFRLDPAPDAMLLGVISRLSWQKGLDLLLENIPTLLGEGIQLALLGSGDRDLQDRYAALAHDNPGRIAVVIGYDEALAHLIQAGADALAVPSRFEPCGLTQLCALRYGAVPVVANVGGLADTVLDFDEVAITGDAPTGVKFAPVTSDALAHGLRKANLLFNDKVTWRRLQQAGMATDVSWHNRAGRYAALYRELATTRR